MTLNAFALEMIRAHGENSGDADYVLTVEQWTRDALDELATLTNWRAFVTNTTLATVASQQFYTLPTRVREIRYVRNPPDDLEIWYCAKEDLVAASVNLEQVGKPRYFYYNDQEVVSNDFRYEIGFYPIPDIIYTLDVAYNIIPADLLTSDHIPVQKNMILPLKFCVRSYMYLDDENGSMANAHYSRFVQTTSNLKAMENTKFADKSRMQASDLPGSGKDGRYAILDPFHFRN